MRKPVRTYMSQEKLRVVVQFTENNLFLKKKGNAEHLLLAILRQVERQMRHGSKNGWYLAFKPM